MHHTILMERAFQIGDEPDSVHKDHLREMVEYYAKTGDKYDAWHCDTTDDSSHNLAVREILRLLANLKAPRLLDVCCGTGRAIRAALDQGYNANGIDASSELLDIAEEKGGIPRSRLKCGDATQLPFPDQSFEVSCILGALHHTSQPGKIISEMIRVTAHGLVISDEANRFSGGMKRLLIALGIFRPVYRLIFRREPRTTRKRQVSSMDGPTFLFSVEEIIPLVRQHFPNFNCIKIYKIGSRQFASRRLPRLFATQAIIVATKS